MVPIRAASAVFLALFTGLIPGPVRGAPAFDAASIPTRFAERQQRSRTVTLEFTQTLRLAGMRQPLVSRGRIFYARPGRLRVEYEIPAGDLLLLPGDGTAVIRKGTGRAVERRLDDAAGSSPELALLLGLFEGRLSPAAAGLRLEPKPPSGDRLVVALTRDPARPAPRGGIESIETILSWPALDPLGVSVRFARGGEVVYEFNNLKRDGVLPAEAFAKP